MPFIRAFNPTLVRLRPATALGMAIPSTSFNPTLVRLRQLEHDSCRLALSHFQSHLGSIAAGLVRPKAGTPYIHLSIPPWFDCGLAARVAGQPGRSTFNPTLVRLRLTLAAPPAGIALLSIPPWFDCGVPTTETVQQIEQLSIPPWFDCGLEGSYRRLAGGPFQSHLGSIAA